MLTLEREQKIKDCSCTCAEPTEGIGGDRCFECNKRIMSAIEKDLFEEVDRLRLVNKALQKELDLVTNKYQDLRVHYDKLMRDVEDSGEL